MPGRRRITLLLAGAAALAAAGVGGAWAFAAGGHARSGDHAGRIVVSDTACAPGWVAPHSGRTTFTVENTSGAATYNVDLTGSDHVSVYGQVERLAPGTSDTMSVILPPGSYSFACESVDAGELDSSVRVVTGPQVTGAHPFTPVTSDQMHLATLSYRASLRPWLARLAHDTDALDRAVAANRVGRAKRLWLTAHLDYARLGAAYDTFGPYNDLIDGRPLGLPRGVRDPNFHGFLRLEYGLWHGRPHAQLAAVAAQLDRSVHGLRRAFPTLKMANGDVALRTHEILENTLQFELTGETDEGSHTNLATAWANVQGTELSLKPITQLLDLSSPGLVAAAQRGLARLGADLLAYRRPDGTWVPLQALTRSEREHLDAATSGLLERLEVIPDRLEIQERLGGSGQDENG
jgi:iron uptake system EfeUOB component EfeO/EfeM